MAACFGSKAMVAGHANDERGVTAGETRCPV